MKAGPTDRSQVFLAVTAEESGLLGSAYYGNHPVFPLGQTVGGVNMDALSMAGVFNNGHDGGQEVEHIHLHLMGGRKFSWPAG